jgi:RNA polymerase sigma-70 factor (sigma-E family)
VATNSGSASFKPVDVDADARRAAGLEFDPEIERFVHASSPGLFRTAILLTGDRWQADDLLQQTLLRTIRRWDHANEAPVAYAQRVLVNLSRDRHRRQRRVGDERSLESAELLTTGRDEHELVIARDVIVQALRRLPIRQREVVVLRFYADLPIAETAATMGTSEGTVKSYTARALERLRSLLTEEPGSLERIAEVRRDDR